MEKKFDELELTGALPTSLSVSLRLLDLAQQEGEQLAALVNVVNADPALALRLIKLANHSRHENSQPIEDVEAAVQRVGYEAARALAMGFTLPKVETEGGPSGFDHEAFWSRSQLVASLCRALARAAGWGNPGRAHCLGLLGDVGTLALANVHSGRYGCLVSGPHRTRGIELAQAESDSLGIDHCEAGYALLKDGGLSHMLATAVLVHEDPDRMTGLGEESRHWAALLQLAQCTAELAEPLGDNDRFGALEERQVQCAGFLGLSMEAVEEAALEACQSWARTREELGSPQSHSPEPELGELHSRAPGSEPTALVGQALAQACDDRAESGMIGRDTSRWGDSARVLLVDDDALTRKVVGAQLRRWGHEVLEATDGRSGLQMALTLQPQILITDWSMPGLSGPELCELLRATKEGQRLSVIMLTALDDEEQIIRGLEAGADDFVAKPCNARILQARVQAGLRTVRLRERTESMESLRLGQAAELGILARQLESAALTDPLTALPNRRYAVQRLEQEWQTAARTGQPLSVIIADVDYFKRVNDTHGHAGGDAVLKAVSDRMRAAARSSDVLCRFGGEEFLTINPACGLQAARRCAERVRNAVALTPIRQARMDLTVTLSLGIAQRTPEMSGPEDLLTAADRALYKAKASGRNRCA